MHRPVQVRTKRHNLVHHQSLDPVDAEGSPPRHFRALLYIIGLHIGLDRIIYYGEGKKMGRIEDEEDRRIEWREEKEESVCPDSCGSLGDLRVVLDLGARRSTPERPW